MKKILFSIIALSFFSTTAFAAEDLHVTVLSKGSPVKHAVVTVYHQVKGKLIVETDGVTDSEGKIHLYMDFPLDEPQFVTADGGYFPDGKMTNLHGFKQIEGLHVTLPETNKSGKIHIVN